MTSQYPAPGIRRSAVAIAAFTLLLFLICSGQQPAQEAKAPSLSTTLPACTLTAQERQDSVAAARLVASCNATLRAGGDPASALAAADSAATIFKRLCGEPSKPYADAVFASGNAHFYQGQVDQALSAWEHVLDMLKPYEGQAQLVASVYTNLCTIYFQTEQYKKALTAGQRGLRYMRQHLPGDNRYTANVLNNLAAVHGRLKDYAKAALYQNRALDIWSRVLPPTYPPLGNAYMNLGNIEQKTGGDAGQAEAYYNQALSIFRANSAQPGIAQVYNNLGDLALREGQYQEALNWHQQALAIRQGISAGAGEPYVADSHFNLGEVYRALKNYPAMEGHYEQAIEIWGAFPGPRRVDLANVQVALADSRVERGAFERAEQAYQRALTELHYEGQDSLDAVPSIAALIEVFENQAAMYRTRAEAENAPSYLRQARNAYRNAFAAIDQQLEQLSYGSKKLLLHDIVPFCEGAIRVNQALSAQTDSVAYLKEAFQFAERAKALLLYQAVQDAEAAAEAKLPNRVLAGERALQRKLTGLQKQEQVLRSMDTPETDSAMLSIQSAIYKNQERLDSLRGQIEERNPVYAKAKQRIDIITVPEVQSELLGREEALVEYFIGDSTAFVFTIQPDAFHLHEIDRSLPLREWGRKVRCSMLPEQIQLTACEENSSEERSKQFAGAAHSLYREVFKPVDELLPANTDILVVPDGVLSYLPFGILLTQPPEPNAAFHTMDYLLDDHCFSYAYSATLQRKMEAKKHQQQPDKPLLAVAPEFGGHTSPRREQSPRSNSVLIYGLQELQGSLGANVSEASMVAEKLKGDSLLREEATEEQFVALADEYAILHLSTHGEADEEIGDYSYIVFHQTPEDSIENELLFNSELYNLQLNADLVVLSSCETGIGERQRGEGIISLARGFSQAGAKSIVTSLWSVDDVSTKVLMEYFYDHLKDGKPKHQALRQAKLDYRKEHPSLGRSPFYWAAFVPVGDSSPLELPGGAWGPLWIWGVIIAIVGLLLWLWLRRSYR
ncbi:MAG: CHAT domain-containing protein [Bacteroidetes bacterium]|nr:CHAT domain-containing protein [Bacteroidota bacterium]